MNDRNDKFDKNYQFDRISRTDRYLVLTDLKTLSEHIILTDIDETYRIFAAIDRF